MAGDWIKMRVGLARDPRVIRMGDFLAKERDFQRWLTDPVQSSCRESAYEHVTRNVTVALCVTGLLIVWGTAREQGDRVGDDLVLSPCDHWVLDAMTDVPCFGRAMMDAGWLIDNEDDTVIFPKFFKDNESPDDRHKRQNAERQARHRERNSNDKVTVDSNVTITHREEKRREELKPKEEAPPKNRLVEPTPEHQALADSLGVACKVEFAKYRDWLAANGKRQKDEAAGFRNWIRKAAEFRPAKPQLVEPTRHGSHVPAKLPVNEPHTEMPDHIRAQLSSLTGKLRVS